MIGFCIVYILRIVIEDGDLEPSFLADSYGGYFLMGITMYSYFTNTKRNNPQI